MTHPAVPLPTVVLAFLVLLGGAAVLDGVAPPAEDELGGLFGYLDFAGFTLIFSFFPLAGLLGLLVLVPFVRSSAGRSVLGALGAAAAALTGLIILFFAIEPTFSGANGGVLYGLLALVAALITMGPLVARTVASARA